MGSIKYIDYNSRSILFLDFEGSASDHDVIELGDKAKRLVKLGSRNKMFLLYNLTDVELTRRIMANLTRLMAHADLVERRVLFGLDAKYEPVVQKLVQLLRLERSTKLCATYTEAVNLITDETQWAQERRHVNLPVAEEKRQAPKVYTEEDFFDFGGGEGRLVQLPEFNLEWNGEWDKD